MSNPPLETKTIRPGSLGAYAQYYHPKPPVTPVMKHGKRRHGKLKLLIIVVILAALGGGGYWLTYTKPAAKVSSVAKQVEQSVTKKAITPTPTPAAPAVAPVVATNYCAGNTLDQLALVSISQRHMWACDGSKTVYDSPVITGTLVQVVAFVLPSTVP